MGPAASDTPTASGPQRAAHPRSAPRHADLIYDLGFHKGEDTDFYLRKGFRVVGIEANPQLAQQGRERFDREIGAGRLTLIEGAIVEPARIRAGESTVVFYSNLDQSVWGTVQPAWADRNRRLGTSIREERVRALDFGEILAVHGIPHYMKIDIEGVDRVCLEVLLDFEARPDYVSIESEMADFGRLTDEIDLLERLGYAGFQAIQQERVARQIPPDPPREGSYVDHRFEHGSSGLFGRELPGPWLGRGEFLARYRWFLRWNRCFGDRSLLRRSWIGRKVLAVLRKATGLPLPGWYDTHARHRSIGA